jgi:hypothetical protein
MAAILVVSFIRFLKVRGQRFVCRHGVANACYASAGERAARRATQDPSEVKAYVDTCRRKDQISSDAPAKLRLEVGSEWNRISWVGRPLPAQETRRCLYTKTEPCVFAKIGPRPLMPSQGTPEICRS